MFCTVLSCIVLYCSVVNRLNHARTHTQLFTFSFLRTPFPLSPAYRGASKVSKAISKDVPRIDLKSLGENIYNTIPSLEQAPTPVITSFSAGYESGRLLQY